MVKNNKLKRVAVAAFWLFAGLVAVGVVVVSGIINFQYGILISIWFGLFFAFFAASEIILPAIAVKCKSRLHQRVAINVAGLLMFLSVITSFAFIQSGRQAVEDAKKGTSQALAGRREDAALAQQVLKNAISTSEAAAASCNRERQRNAINPTQGYVTKRCGEAEKAALAVEKAQARVESSRVKADQSAVAVIPANERVFHDIAGILPGSAKMWQTIITSLFSVLSAGMPFIYFWLFAHVYEESKKKAGGSVVRKDEPAVTEQETGGDPSGSKKKPSVKVKQKEAPSARPAANVVPIRRPPPAKPATKSQKQIAENLVKSGKLKPSYRSLSGDRAKSLGLNVGNDTAGDILGALESKGVIVKKSKGRGYDLTAKHSSGVKLDG